MDTCENCGRTIGKLEQAFVFQQSPVCAECYARLAKPHSTSRRVGLIAIVGATVVVVCAGMYFTVSRNRAPLDTAPTKVQVVGDAPLTLEITENPYLLYNKKAPSTELTLH